MSHIVEIKTQVRDAAAVQAACRRLGLSPPVHGANKLFTASVTGLAVQLPGWRYPVVCRIAAGEVDAVVGRLSRLGADLEDAEPARRREVFREMVERIDLRFDRKPRGKRVECPLLSGEIHLRTGEGSIFGSVSRGDRI